MALFIIYTFIIFALSFYAVHKKCTSDAFFLNNRSSSASYVALSIIASCVGGSATIGMAGLAWQVGTPAFWWLGTGAIGLVILTIFLARIVRQSGARTMPEMLESFIGKAPRPAISLIIVAAWLSIAAAQFSAMAAIVTPLTGLSMSTSLILSTCIVVLYACIGGQSAIIKSDAFQYIILIIALLVALLFFLFPEQSLYVVSIFSSSSVNAEIFPVVNSNPIHSFLNTPIELLNEGFNASRFRYFLCILGGSYIVCPMLFSRLLSARDEKSAYLGSLYAVVGLCLSAALIVAVGIACRYYVSPTISSEQVLTTAILNAMPLWLGHFVLLGLFSAIISSADSCLITAATVLSNDILKRSDTFTCRICLLGIGLGGYILSTGGKGVLQLLLMANDIYVCGVVMPVFIAMLLYKKYAFQQYIITAAILFGGFLGLMSSITGDTMYSYSGLVVSGFITVCALRKKVKS
ncbi:MAG: hypothetical protein R3Y11_03050 [Pseudomonadota bacterium]